jgi:hypothetical protein
MSNLFLVIDFLRKDTKNFRLFAYMAEFYYFCRSPWGFRGSQANGDHGGLHGGGRSQKMKLIAVFVGLLGYSPYFCT